MSLVLVNKRNYLASITTNEAREAKSGFNRDDRNRVNGIGIYRLRDSLLIMDIFRNATLCLCLLICVAEWLRFIFLRHLSSVMRALQIVSRQAVCFVQAKATRSNRKSCS